MTITPEDLRKRADKFDTPYCQFPELAQELCQAADEIERLEITEAMAEAHKACGTVEELMHERDVLRAENETVRTLVKDAMDLIFCTDPYMPGFEGERFRSCRECENCKLLARFGALPPRKEPK